MSEMTSFIVSSMPIRLTQVGPLNEFVFRFNRRFWPMVTFDSVLKIAARVEKPTYRDLYESTRAHPNPARSQMTCANRIGMVASLRR